MAESTEAGAKYLARQKGYVALRDAQLGKSAVLARLRLATFLPAIAALVWWMGFAGGIPAFALALVLLLAFGALVVRHARVEERAARFEALRVVNVRGAARIARDWDALPEAPAPVNADVDGHPYAIDLDVFGRASLFQWIGPGATDAGHLTLAGWLLSPAPPEEISARQAAISELSSRDGWREQLAAFGVLGAGERRDSIATFLQWAESPGPSVRGLPVIRVAVYVIVASLWIFGGLHFSGIMPNGFWGIPLLAGIVLSFATAAAVTRAFDQAGAGERTLAQYAGIFEHIAGERFASPRLAALQERMTAEGRPAPEAMRSLNRILSFADMRRGAALLHFPIQALTLWDFHWLFALEGWRRATGARVGRWFEATAELDALSCLSAVHHDNPDWCFAVLTKGEAGDRVYRAAALGHPLLPADRRVANDVELGPPGTVLLVTGSNMSGKSTLLRAIGANAVLAQCGAPVCARSLHLPPCDVQTSIRIQDSLERGVSYFMAALARLKGVVDAAEREPGDRALLYLLDEILQGTNSAERGIAVQAVTRHLLDAGAIGAMTTHDLNLAGEEPLRSTARLVHFTEIVDEQGTMRFDYRLREGLATSRNALRLMQLIGIDIRTSVNPPAPSA
ncbi:MutS family DNA mismatch repair protein [soil metagenome]